MPDLTFRGGQISVSGGPHIVENPPARDDLPRYSAAHLAVENVGRGPALKVRGVYTGPRGSGSTGFPLEAVAAGEKDVVSFENWEGDSLGYGGNDDSVSATVEYEDLAGTTHRTEVTFDIGHNAYRATFQPPTEM